jgi:predicted PurR-regulated permease PerM
MSKMVKKPGGDSVFQRVSFVLILTAITACFVYMLRDFVMTLLLASVFTSISYPIYMFLLRKLRKPYLASLATLLFLLVVLVLPVAAIIAVAYHEAWEVFRSIDFAALPGNLAHLAEETRNRFPSLFARMSPDDISRAATSGLRQTLQWSLNHGAVWTLALADNLMSFFLMLFMMFYFYIDGKRFLNVLMRWSPLRDDYETILLQKFLAVSRATLKGLLVIGVIQGAFGGLLFWAVGIGSPVLLGAVIVFCSIIPVVGVGIVWIPAILYLLFQGHVGSAIVLASLGAVVISVIDNVLRPRVVGQNIKMHDLMVLLSTLGGLGLFGLPGFIIGPIVASLFLSIWAMFEEVFAPELEQNRIHPPTELSL